LIATEPGGHRWQRVPPNEKRGRVHTSTVTVVVLDVSEAASSGQKHVLDMRDVAIETYRGSGPGGQHRNKTESCARATHRPTGLEAKSESERSQHQNIQYALATLAARVRDHERNLARARAALVRKEQAGTGQRGDKVRTIRVQDGVVTCERTGRKHRLKEYLRGDLDWLA
jgi:peptide chain release factor 1